MIKNNIGHKFILIIADGSAIASEMDNLMDLMYNHTNGYRLALYLSESIEWIILHSILFNNDSNVQETLAKGLDIIDSRFKSSEEFYTNIIKNASSKSSAKYSKGKLGNCYLEDCCIYDHPCRLYIEGNKISCFNKLIPLVNESEG